MLWETFLKRVKRQAHLFVTAGMDEDEAYQKAIAHIIRLAAEHQAKVTEIFETMGEDMLPAVSRETIGENLSGVYFVQATTGSIKIGQADHIWRRLSNLRTSAPLELRLVGFIATHELDEVEREMHHKFAQYRFQGEWFLPGPELMKYIASIQGSSHE